MPPQIYDYKDRLENIVTELLPDQNKNHRGQTFSHKPKVIHDSMWGSRLFYPWEIELIDTKLLQRLRHISQLGTAYFTYPSAVHNRFSHSLGVSILAGRLITRLREKAEIENEDIEISPKDIYTVRLAGLLHDIGHCFFSHCSEAVLKNFRDTCFETLRRIDTDFQPTKKPKPHELIGYLILNTDAFNKYWKKHITPFFPNKEGHDNNSIPSPGEISKLIVGITPSPEKRFLKEIISGPYDVDKLEYLYRDASMAGLAISYDIERFFYKIKIKKTTSGGAPTKRLVMEEGGVRAVEQLIFSKMMLFSFVYHHQKILNTDSIVVDMLYELLKQGAKGDLKIEHPLDFLRYNDTDILSNAVECPSEKFRTLRNRLMSRDLPKRCLVLNREFIKNLDPDEEVSKGWDNLKQDAKNIEKRNRIREEIISKANKNNPKTKITEDQLYINIPSMPDMSESVKAPIEASNGEITTIGKFQNIEGWQKTYESKKFRGYFFADSNILEIVTPAIEKYLREHYKIELTSIAKKEAKNHSANDDIN